MKKQILIFTSMIITVVFMSCSKQAIEKPGQSISEEIATASERSNLIPNGDINKGLLGLYEFNSSLIEKTGRLSTGSPDGTVSYTFDRKGFRGRALKFNGDCTVSLGYIPHSQKMSVAAWVKYDLGITPASLFILSQSDGPKFSQANNQIYTSNNPSFLPYLSSGAIDNQWHFLVTTIDGTNLKLYVDGVLKGTVASPDVDNANSAIYLLGYGNTSEEDWHGAIDDLRFYNRALTATEIQTLRNL